MRMRIFWLPIELNDPSPADVELIRISAVRIENPIRNGFESVRG